MLQCVVLNQLCLKLEEWAFFVNMKGLVCVSVLYVCVS